MITEWFHHAGLSKRQPIRLWLAGWLVKLGGGGIVEANAHRLLTDEDDIRSLLLQVG